MLFLVLGKTCSYALSLKMKLCRYTMMLKNPAKPNRPTKTGMPTHLLSEEGGESSHVLTIMQSHATVPLKPKAAL